MHALTEQQVRRSFVNCSQGEAKGLTLPESSIVIEYAAPAMIPSDPEAALQARLWDRVFDNYVALPMQRIVADTFRPAGLGDAVGVEQARALIGTAYGIADAQLAGRPWAAGDSSPSLTAQRRLPCSTRTS